MSSSGSPGRQAVRSPSFTRGARHVRVGVAGEVLAAGQPDLPALVDLVVVHLHRGREVAHRVAGAPDRAGVGLGAVDDPAVVHRELAALQLEVDGLVLVDLGDLGVEGLDRSCRSGRSSGGPEGQVRARDDPHAAVLAGAGVLQGEPDGHDAVVGAEPAVPEGAVLVPRRLAAGERVLGDEVARPQRDVRARPAARRCRGPRRRAGSRAAARRGSAGCRARRRACRPCRRGAR